MHRALLWAAIAHAGLALLCLLALWAPAAPILGVHPVLKPFKFALSISLFLFSLAALLPSLSLRPWLREALAWTFALTMVMEMIPIVGQALRGTSSHFNTSGALDRAAWGIMFTAILVATAAMIGVTAVAVLRPLSAASGGIAGGASAGRAMEPVLAFAWRAGLCLLLLSPVSGFAMGGRLQHSIGGADGGRGLPLVNWSVTHGDLRVAHFFALHALQLLPLTAWLLLRWRVAAGLRWGVLLALTAGLAALCVVTLGQAFAGRPFLAVAGR